jgi:hypothetical protein
VTLPPCAGRWELFDSTYPADHIQARDMCRQCPMLADCRDQLEAARKDAHVGRDYGPQGTWAGQLVGAGPRVTAARARAEEAMFTGDELRAGHSAYVRGDRDERTRMAERIYQRKRVRSPKGAAA